MSLEEQVGTILSKNNWTLSIAESCTGGYLAHLLTNVSGSSTYFSRGYIVYSKEAKNQDLGIDLTFLDRFGVYSKEVAEAMAEGVRKKTMSTFAVSITGIAPPGDPTSDKPTGIAYVSFSSENFTTHKEILIESKNRIDYKERVVRESLVFLLDSLKYFTG